MSCSSTVHAIPKWRTCLAHLFPPGARIAGCSLTSHDSCDMLWYFFLAPKTVLFHPIFQSHRFSPGKQWYIPSIWSNCRSLVIFRVLCLSAIDNSKVIGSAFCLGCAVNSSCTILFVEFDWHSVHVSAFLPINFITHCENMWEPFPILALHHHFYPDILDVHSWAWSKKMGTESFQAQISNSSRWVFQVGGALCLFRAHHFWSSHELSTCCSLNAGPKLATQEHPWNVPKESAMKVRSTSFACSFFFFWGVYNNLAVSQFISCLHLVYPIFFAASFLGTLGPVGRWPGLGWNHQIKVDEELPPPTERSRVETVHRSARVHCECLGWPCFCRGDDWHHAHYKKQNEGWAEFLCENICEGKAVSTSWKKASHASRTPLLRWPAGFVLIFCAAVSIYCDAFADVIGLFGACFGTLICIIWPLRRESFMVLPVSSVFDCLKMFKIYTGSLSREDCAWLYLTAHIFRFIKKIDLFHV